MSLKTGLILKFFSCLTCIAGKKQTKKPQKPLWGKDAIIIEINGAQLESKYNIALIVDIVKHITQTKQKPNK